jgi:hypothetical protein
VGSSLLKVEFCAADGERVVERFPDGAIGLLFVRR